MAQGVIDLYGVDGLARMSVANPIPVSSSGVAPIGGVIAWGAATAVAMIGASKTFIPANAARKAIIFWSPAGNAAAGYELNATATATIAGSIPLVAGMAPTVFTGGECPTGIVPAIGTAAQSLYYVEGV